MVQDDDARPAPKCHDVGVSDITRPQRTPKQRAIDAIATTRESGGFFYAHFVGVRGGTTDVGRSQLAVLPAPGQPRPSTMAVGTLADLALGSALRSALGTGLLMPTVDLTLTLVREPRGEVVAQALALPKATGSDTATASCDLSDSDGRVGLASGTFALRPAAGAVRSMPWDTALSSTRPADRPGPPSLAPGDLSPEERACLEAVTDDGGGASGGVDAVDDALLGFSASPHESENTRVEARVGPTLANRAGYLHGGALIALVARTARAALGPQPSDLHTVTLQFLRPITGPELSGSASVLRRGRSSGVVAVDVMGLRQGQGVPLTTALVGLKVGR